LPLLRGITPTALEVFDFAEQGMVTGRRDTTTVAPQALYVLNDPFVRSQSQVLAERLFQRADLDDAGKIHWAYRVTLGRTATSTELERALRYVADYESDLRVVIAAAKPPAAAEAAGVDGKADEAAAADKKKAAAPANPDDPVPGEEQPDEKSKLPSDPKLAAWSSFCQALIASAEFRYLK
jgi:hypothetical protein